MKYIASALHKTHRYGDFQIHVFENDKKDEIAVLTKGDLFGAEDLACRIASECLPGIVLDSRHCECKEQLEFSLEYLGKQEKAILIFLRQEGRGQGLGIKIQALNNKNQGYDTFVAVEMLGKKADVREFTDAVEVLKYFGVKSVRLLTNNEDKIRELENSGISVNERVSVEVAPTEDTYIHLKAKKARGHKLEYDYK